MKGYNLFKDLRDVSQPPRGFTITDSSFQSGPFALLPASDSIYFGYNSTINFGNANFVFAGITFDLSFQSVPVKTNTNIICTINYTDGIPYSHTLSSAPIGQSVQFIKFYDSRPWPSPSNVEFTSIILGQILPYNESLKSTYGDSVTFGNGYSAIRTCNNSINMIQTCYGFVAISSPY